MLDHTIKFRRVGPQLVELYSSEHGHLAAMSPATVRMLVVLVLDLWQKSIEDQDALFDLSASDEETVDTILRVAGLL